MLSSGARDNNAKRCFICANLGMNLESDVVGNYFGFPLCGPHFAYLNSQENKAEAAGNLVWKEVWDDTMKDRKEDVESAINSIIVLRGSLRDLPKELYEAVSAHKLDKKYLKFL